MAKEQLRFTGSGGQGVILGTIIIAEAAYMDGKNVVQSQSYGPEARGGMCKAEAIIDQDKITYTKVTDPTLLLSLTQISFNKYVKDIHRNTVIIVDDSINVPQRVKEKQEVISLPIIHSAKEIIKNPMASNIISVGAVNEALKLASEKSLEAAVLNHVPKGTEELNVRAMKLGAKLVKIYRGEIKPEAKKESTVRKKEAQDYLFYHHKAKETLRDYFEGFSWVEMANMECYNLDELKDFENETERKKDRTNVQRSYQTGMD